MVLGRSRKRRCSGAPLSSTLENNLSRPGTVAFASPSERSYPEIWSKISFDVAVLLQTTMNTGGVPLQYVCHFANTFS